MRRHRGTILDRCRRTTPEQDALRDRLRAAAPLDDDAAARAWAVTRAAHAAREPLPARRSRVRRLRALLALGAALLLGGLALSPAGADVGHWIDGAISPPPSRPAAALPAPGRLLVTSATGLWVVEHDLRPRRLGSYRGAGWSAKGNYVVATGRDTLVALTDEGELRWWLRRPRTNRAVWSGGDGFRVAYRSGRELRVVAGDGSGDALVAPVSAPVAPAWRPDGAGEHVLAYALPDGRVMLHDADGRSPGSRVLLPRGSKVHALAWAGRDRLVVLRGGWLLILDARGRVVGQMPPPDEGAFATLIAAPVGRAVALVRHDDRTGMNVIWVLRQRGAASLSARDLRRRAEVEPLELAGAAAGLPGVRARILFVGEGKLGRVAFSPDGRWLVIPWRVADQWIFVRTSGRPRIVTVEGISRRLDPDARRPPNREPGGERFGVVGWAR